VEILMLKVVEQLQAVEILMLKVVEQLQADYILMRMDHLQLQIIDLSMFLVNIIFLIIPPLQKQLVEIMQK